MRLRTQAAILRHREETVAPIIPRYSVARRAYFLVLGLFSVYFLFQGVLLLYQLKATGVVLMDKREVRAPLSGVVTNLNVPQGGGTGSARFTIVPVRSEVVVAVQPSNTDAMVRAERDAALKRSEAEMLQNRLHLLQKELHFESRLELGRWGRTDVPGDIAELQARVASAYQEERILRQYIRTLRVAGRPAGGSRTTYPDTVVEVPSGMVGEVVQREGDYVREGEPVLVISHHSTARVEVLLEAKHYNMVDPGKLASVMLPNGKSIEAKVARVGSTANNSGQPDVEKLIETGAPLRVTLTPVDPIKDAGALVQFGHLPVTVKFNRHFFWN